MANQVKERLKIALEITCGKRGIWELTEVERNILLGEVKIKFDLQTTTVGRIGTIQYTAEDIVQENLSTLFALIDNASMEGNARLEVALAETATERDALVDTVHQWLDLLHVPRQHEGKPMNIRERFMYHQRELIAAREAAP